jgi:hypothetical protein
VRARERGDRQFRADALRGQIASLVLGVAPSQKVVFILVAAGMSRASMFALAVA